MLSILIIYFAAGSIAGVLAGLLGIGGGLVIVPIMLFGLSRQGVGQEHLMHLALGTSMASIVFTSISSFRAHHKRGAVHWNVVRNIVLGILTGKQYDADQAKWQHWWQSQKQAMQPKQTP